MRKSDRKIKPTTVFDPSDSNISSKKLEEEKEENLSSSVKIWSDSFNLQFI